MARFDPEKMAVYGLARQHSRAVHALLETADTRGFADLVGQLRSSAISIPANLLEAAGEWRPGKRLHYLMIAKGSTWESWAHTDSMVDFGLVRTSAITEVRGLQGQITALLITTIPQSRNHANQETRNRGTLAPIGVASHLKSKSKSKLNSFGNDPSSRTSVVQRLLAAAH